MKEYLSYDDVLIIPKFSFIKSRKDVSLNTKFLGLDLKNPMLSSNMDTVTTSIMAKAIYELGGLGCLHRFWSIETNVKEYKLSPPETIVSVGVGEEEFKRFKSLLEAGASRFLIDVAHGAMQIVVDQYKAILDDIKLCDRKIYVAVGNFATYYSILEFNRQLRMYDYKLPDAYKIGIGNGSLCTTRIQTGCGMPILSSLLDCQSFGIPLIADGGCRNSGDIAKALAAGATMIMSGGLMSGTYETPGEQFYQSHMNGKIYNKNDYELLFIDKYKEEDYKNSYTLLKKYRGSASLESYEVQGKIADHRTPEGESTYVEAKGPLKNVIQNLEAGIKSAFTYTGSCDILEFKKNAELIKITTSGIIENGAYGKHND